MLRANHSLEMLDVFTHPLVSGNLGGRPMTPCILPYPVVAPGEFLWGLRGLAQLDSMPSVLQGSEVLGTPGGVRSFQAR